MSWQRLQLATHLAGRTQSTPLAAVHVALVVRLWQAHPVPDGAGAKQGKLGFWHMHVTPALLVQVGRVLPCKLMGSTPTSTNGISCTLSAITPGSVFDSQAIAVMARITLTKRTIFSAHVVG